MGVGGTPKEKSGGISYVNFLAAGILRRLPKTRKRPHHGLELNA
jgi:hypothetical protein